MWRLQCSWHDRYLRRGTEFNGKCGSSTMLAELTASPAPRDTVANANRTWLTFVETSAEFNFWTGKQSRGSIWILYRLFAEVYTHRSKPDHALSLRCFLVLCKAAPYDHPKDNLCIFLPANWTRQLKLIGFGWTKMVSCVSKFHRVEIHEIASYQTML